MKKIEFSVATNRVGSKVTEVVEFEDDVTDEEIEDSFSEWMWSQLDAYHRPAEK